MVALSPLKWPLYLQTIFALTLGVIVGLWFGPPISVLSPVSQWMIQVIKWLAVPLLFLAICDAVLQREFEWKGLLSLGVVCAINGVFAILIGLGISAVFKPGTYLPLHATLGSVNPTQSWQNFSAAQLLGAGLASPMVVAILLGILTGIVAVVTLRGEKEKKFRALTSRGLQLIILLLGKVIAFVPIAIFVATAAVVGKTGMQFAAGLGAYLFSCLLGMGLHVFLVYQAWVLFYARIPLKRFWEAAREPMVHAFGINSSLATLPVTLKSLDRLKVSPGAARMSACVGTNFNNDGILLYEVVAVLFMVQAYGITLSFSEQLITTVLCLIATIGVGGIPEAGILSLTLVLSAVQLPLEGIPILLTVDWILARTRSSVNVLGDMTGAIAIDTYSRRAVKKLHGS